MYVNNFGFIRVATHMTESGWGDALYIKPVNYFNNCDSKTNGELLFFETNKNSFNVIFDVGCRVDTEFMNFTGEVHYFDPVEDFINKLRLQKCINSKSYFNAFGLGEETKEIEYYPKYQSFYDRTISCTVSDADNKINLKIKSGQEYISENQITTIDFLKIDTEGYEVNVLKGFGQAFRNS